MNSIIFSNCVDDGRKGLGGIRGDFNFLSLGNWDWKGIVIGWVGFKVKMSFEFKKICRIWDGSEIFKRRFLGVVRNIGLKLRKERLCLNM